MMNRDTVVHKSTRGEPRKEIADTVIMLVKNIPEATLCKVLTNDRQRIMIVGKILKIMVGLGTTMVLKNSRKRIG